MTDAATARHAPAFARGVRLRWDDTRRSWLLLGPERVIMADDAAAAILQLIDGERSVSAIAAALAEDFAAPQGQIEEDVSRLLEELTVAGFVR
jgi:pyrroloquinoline quinone biosynthesis protein D